MIKLAGKDSEDRTSDQIRQEPEKVDEHSSDHPGEEDDRSDLAERQQDPMEANGDFWSIVSLSDKTFKNHNKARFSFH